MLNGGENDRRRRHRHRPRRGKLLWETSRRDNYILLSLKVNNYWTANTFACKFLPTKSLELNPFTSRLCLFFLHNYKFSWLVITITNTNHNNNMKVKLLFYSLHIYDPRNQIMTLALTKIFGCLAAPKKPFQVHCPITLLFVNWPHSLVLVLI